MNNGDKLNQMTNEEKAIFIGDIEAEWAGTEFDKSKPVSEFLLEYLNTEIPKTPDEEFAEIGLINKQEGTDSILYVRCTGDCIQHLCIMEDEIFYKANRLIIHFSDKEIDKIRIIAQKKRKEVWG